MDGLESPQPQQKENKGLMFLEVGVLEIFFIVITLSIFFGVMNYFNILPISEVFPNQLGWLPHKPYRQSQQYTPKVPPLADNSTSNTTSAPPLASTAQAKQTLLVFLPTILSSSLLPKSPDEITLTEDKDTKEIFTAFWNTKEGIAKTVVFTSSVAKKNIALSLTYTKTLSLSPSVESAQTIASQSFIVQPKGKWGCKELPELPGTEKLRCENFWEENDGTRRGIGIEGYRLSSQVKKSTFFFCEHSQESSFYSWKSCYAEFAKTGIVQ